MSDTGWRPTDSFGTRLLLVRREKQLSVEVASATVGVKQASWSSWERGTQPRNIVNVVSKISDGLGVDRDWLMWGGALTPAGSAPGEMSATLPATFSDLVAA
jgi:transcriptional regulator with XRE-family HTH domain